MIFNFVRQNVLKLGQLLLLGVILITVQQAASLPIYQKGGGGIDAGRVGILTNRWAVEVAPGVDPTLLAAQYGLRNRGQIGLLQNIYLFEGESNSPHDERMAQLLGNTAVLWSQQQVAFNQHTRGGVPTDPLVGDQWHLKNSGQTGGTAGVDVNIEPVWNAGYTGEGILIGVLDDGLQWDHPDLSPNYVANASYDYNDDDGDPYPEFAGDGHGTSAAGVAAASDDGASCGVGAAYNAQLSGLRILGADIDDAGEANALNHQAQVIDIYSNSWGPVDSGLQLEGPGPLVRQALEAGVYQGRNGLGNIYVWAAGNGLEENQNVNLDGYANSPYTIAVGAIDHDGVQSWYSEPGAAMFVTAPSGGDTVEITTTDLMGSAGYDSGSDCTSTFSGTSSSTPLVSGVIALMLEANPNLTWRDVQHILAATAVPNHNADPGWYTNAAGYPVNHKYGFGRVDASAAVGTAQNWQNVAPVTVLTTNTMPVNTTIPDDDPNGIVVEVQIVDEMTLEHVELIFVATHSYRGDLQIILESPSGTQSVLADLRDDSNADYVDDTWGGNWRFMTVHNWGETAVGTWRLYVSDLAGGDEGTLNSWELVLHGTTAQSHIYLPIIVGE